ncbi:MAG: hypothetical protein ACTSUE_11230 [Promethearchaeota archaeon]
MYNVLGWLLLVVAGVFITLLLLHAESNKPISFKFTIPSVVIISLCVGYGIHFLLIASGV